ncbi:MAG TPA: hypothetical protein VE223_08055 [Nitrososphaeraceae archaeon]|nr:hypothetical protein [Nitrososphaeraceae archaeon]
MSRVLLEYMAVCKAIPKISIGLTPKWFTNRVDKNAESIRSTTPIGRNASPDENEE